MRELTHLKQGLGATDTPLGAADGRQDMAAGYAPGGRGRLPVMGELTSGWLIGYQEN